MLNSKNSIHIVTVLTDTDYSDDSGQPGAAWGSDSAANSKNGLYRFICICIDWCLYKPLLTCDEMQRYELGI